MTELLAPAGSMEALIAAVSNGADAIYLAAKKFGARAYASNFDFDELKEAIIYAHLRGVKIYVTMNIIVYTNELEEAYSQLIELYKLGVDGIICCDMALFTYIVNNLSPMEAHSSTQMGIDDLEGTLLLKELGAKRVVLSREVLFDDIKRIKAEANIPIEIFTHGALCVSYSGNCLFSGLVGYRSGNRGRCVGSCRKKYQVINTTTDKMISNSYILSLKDLNTIDHINELKQIDSLKIEGRMKEPEYVANVVGSYRKAIDGIKFDRNLLSKTFNRTYTKGYIFGCDKKEMSNIDRPNNYGILVGEIARKVKKGYVIKLTDTVNQGDVIRIDHKGIDINMSLAMIYDLNDNLISSANKECIVKFKEDASIGDKVYKTKDIKYTNELLASYPRELNRVGIDVTVYGDVGNNLTMEISCEGTDYYVTSDFILDEAKTKPTTDEDFKAQLAKLTDSVYELNELNYYLDNVFIPKSKINELRRLMVEELNNNRVEFRDEPYIIPTKYKKLNVCQEQLGLVAYCTTEAQYNICKEYNLKAIYYKDNYIRRNLNNYKKKNGLVLVGGYGGIYYYRNTNEFVTDYSLNIVNAVSLYTMHKLGAKRVCISHELNLGGINDMTSKYYEMTGEYANLEMIVYGRAKMMHTKYCPLKVLNQCGKCRENKYIIKDEYGEFPILNEADCTTTLLNGKILNLIDDLESIKNVNTFRLDFTLEDENETRRVLEMYLNKIKNMDKTSFFNSSTDTRGNLKREIL